MHPKFISSLSGLTLLFSNLSFASINVKIEDLPEDAYHYTNRTLTVNGSAGFAYSINYETLQQETGIMGELKIKNMNLPFHIMDTWQDNRLVVEAAKPDNHFLCETKALEWQVEKLFFQHSHYLRYPDLYAKAANDNTVTLNNGVTQGDFALSRFQGTSLLHISAQKEGCLAANSFSYKRSAFYLPYPDSSLKFRPLKVPNYTTSNAYERLVGLSQLSGGLARASIPFDEKSATDNAICAFTLKTFQNKNAFIPFHGFLNLGHINDYKIAVDFLYQNADLEIEFASGTDWGVNKAQSLEPGSASLGSKENTTADKKDDSLRKRQGWFS